MLYAVLTADYKAFDCSSRSHSPVRFLWVNDLHS